MIFDFLSTTFDAKRLALSDFQSSLHKIVNCQVPLRGDKYQFFRQALTSYFGTSDLIQALATQSSLDDKRYNLVFLRILGRIFQLQNIEQHAEVFKLSIYRILINQQRFDQSVLDIINQYCEL